VEHAIRGNNSSSDWFWRFVFYTMFQYFRRIYKPGLVPGLGITSQRSNMPTAQNVGYNTIKILNISFAGDNPI